MLSLRVEEDCVPFVSDKKACESPFDTRSTKKLMKDLGWSLDNWTDSLLEQLNTDSDEKLSNVLRIILNSSTCKDKVSVNRLFTEAARRGLPKCVQYLTDEQNVNSYAYALYCAVAASHGDVVRVLLKHTEYVSPLVVYKAARNNDTTILEMLLSHGGGLNEMLPSGMAPLHDAVRRRDVTCVQILLVYGADPNVETAAKETPVFVASRKGYVGILKLLLSYGGKPNTGSGYGPLHTAVLRGNDRQLRKQIQENKFIHPVLTCAPPPRTKYSTVVELLLAYGGDPNALSCDGHSPLHLAVMVHSDTLARLLLAHNANPNVKTFNGATPLAFAVTLDAMCGGTSFAEMLLEYGSDPGVMDARGWTPVNVAVAFKDKALERVLLDSSKKVKRARKATRACYSQGATPPPPRSPPSCRTLNVSSVFRSSVVKGGAMASRQCVCVLLP